jgi:hypothetical protein
MLCMLVKYTDATHVLFMNEALFSLSGYVNSQNNRNWLAENPILID